MPQGLVLGTYPGCLLPLQQSQRKLQQHPACLTYIWRFGDSKYILDPTDTAGELQATVRGGNPNVPGSVQLFEILWGNSIIIKPVTTELCRINVPPRGYDVNVITEEDLQNRKVVMRLERTVKAGEELFMDYGLSYDRSRYNIK